MDLRQAPLSWPMDSEDGFVFPFRRSITHNANQTFGSVLLMGLILIVRSVTFAADSNQFTACSLSSLFGLKRNLSSSLSIKNQRWHGSLRCTYAVHPSAFQHTPSTGSSGTLLNHCKFSLVQKLTRVRRRYFQSQGLFDIPTRITLVVAPINVFFNWLFGGPACCWLFLVFIFHSFHSIPSWTLVPRRTTCYSSFFQSCLGCLYFLWILLCPPHGLVTDHP